ncbi:hypothetical protein OA845_02355 [Candidatus Pelagibacter sp.]|nr:hypothetical protein [Candidatus Pelagibacter sp.]
MKRSLIISFNLEPYNTPRAIRLGSILDHISNKKILVDVVTYKKNKKRYSKNIKIHSHENFLFNKFFNKSPEKKYKNSFFFTNIFNQIIIKFILSLYKFIGKYIIWPDYAFFSILSFYKNSAKLIEKKKINHLITISHPFSCHIVGLLLKKKFPNIVWDAESSDPFSLMQEPKPNNIHIYKYINYFFEKKVLVNCRRFYVNNYETKKKYLKYFYGFKKKIIILEPLSLFQKNRINKLSFNTKYNLVYAGAFYKKIRNPEPLFDVFDKLINKYPILKKQIRLNIFTDSSLFYDKIAKYPHLNSYIFVNKPIEYFKLMNFMTNETIALNLGNKNNLQIPSKLYEMIGKGLKIINIHYNIDKNSRKILHGYPNYINLNIDKKINLKLLYNFFKKKKNKSFDEKTFNKKYKKNTLKYISRAYFN